MLQVHRYLDLGASWKVCHGPVAVFAAEAVRDLRSFGIRKPVLLAESGAVEPSHSGPFKLYAKDRDGILLHDVLFAPFFAGAAGPGHIWHWDVYVDRNDLWRHFARFAAAVRGLDPSAEAFEPFELPHARLFILGLKGRRTTILWCRDRENTWRTELAEGKEPELLREVRLDLGPAQVPLKDRTVQSYDPWSDTWQTGAAGDHAFAPRLQAVARPSHRAASGLGPCSSVIRREKGTGPICRNGPKGASHKLDLSPFSQNHTTLFSQAVLAGTGPTTSFTEGAGRFRIAPDVGPFWRFPQWPRTPPISICCSASWLFRAISSPATP